MNNNPNPRIPNESNPDSQNENEELKPSSSNTSSLDEVLKKFKENGQEFAKFMGESAGVFNFHIDSRSGGAYFTDRVNIAGDVVGRDQAKGAINSSAHRYLVELAGQIRKGEIEKLHSVYLETSNYKKVKQILQDHNMLFLYGQSDHGKRATAIYLTISLLQSEEIFEINPTIEDLGVFKSEDQRGYIIDSLTLDTIKKLNKSQINKISQELKHKKSYLVIAIDNLSSAIKQSLEDYISEWSWSDDGSQSTALLKKHFLWYLKIPETQIGSYAEILEHESVCQLLSQGLLPGEINKLAELLAQTAKGDFPLEESLARFGSSANQQVEIWFDQHQDIEDRTKMISLAVLSGANYEYFKEASNNLRLSIQPIETTNDKEQEQVKRLENKRSKFLEEFGAKIVYGDENKHYGQIKVELIELKNQAFQKSILRYVWQEYDQWREPILKWLSSLGSHKSSEVKYRIAAALGQLSIYAFGHVIDEVLQPWANSPNQELQRLSTLALSIPVCESELAPQVLKLIQHWSTLKNNQRLQMTATIAYGGYIGTRFPQAAFRDLLAIVQSEEPSMAIAVLESMISLFFFGELYIPVLATLQEWSKENKNTLAHTLSLFIFTLIMKEVEVPDTQPILLWLIREEGALAENKPELGKECKSKVIYLLRQALNLKLTRKSALEGLYKSLQFADYDHSFYPVIGQILYEMVAQGTDRERERIIYHLNQWAIKDSPCAASKIRLKIQKLLGI